MRILITNHRLDLRTGTELYAGELAGALARRGHEVALFSPLCGALADELRAAGLEVVDDPRALKLAPEVIHGQHHLATMAALVAHPGVAAIYLCHGYAPWEEWPPGHPRIVRYAAVSSAFRPWFEREFGIPGDSLEVVRNGLDLQRFAQVRKPSKQPQRALVFDNDMQAGADFELIAQACSERSIDLDALGRGFGKTIEEPSAALPEYDLVFASGRSALEAIACGCAVILMRDGQLAELVTADRLEYHWDRNFALGSRGEPLQAQALLEQIDRYAPADAAQTTRQLRAAADRDLSVEQLLGLYAAAIDESSGKTNSDRSQAESESLAAYLGKIAGHVGQADAKFTELRKGWEATKAKRQLVRAELERAKQRLGALESFFSRGWLRRRLWRAARQEEE